MDNEITPSVLQAMYASIEKSFTPMTSENCTPWVRKNPSEKEQTFPQYKGAIKGTTRIEEILIYEMWEEQKDQELAEREK